MDKSAAETMLFELAQDKKIDGKPYSFAHIKNVAVLAEKIAGICGLDSDKAYVFGLLHDIGRFFVADAHGELAVDDKHRHPIEGYLFLQKRGYRDEAKICITHAFIQHENIYSHMYTEKENQIIAQILEEKYNVYDMLIQLADEMSVMKGWCSLESRMAREAMEQGCSIEVWKKFLCLHDIKKMFDKLSGRDIYSLILGNIVFA